jgi:polyphosphate kinase 2 (PPK2 family)
VLVVRVHPELLSHSNVPGELLEGDLWDRRYEDIRAFEKHLSRNGTVIRKFFLHVSHAEQKRRLLARLDEPAKQWKFSAADVVERTHWKRYMSAYEDAIRATASERSPWYVIPADHKWFTRIVVAAVLVDALASLELEYPKLSPAQRTELTRARKALEND